MSDTSKPKTKASKEKPAKTAAISKSPTTRSSSKSVKRNAVRRKNSEPDTGTQSGFAPDHTLRFGPVAFAFPERTTRSAWTEHVPFLFWLMDCLRPASFVELGAHNGMSYCAACQVVDALRLDTVCYAVDSWKGDDHAGHYGESVFAELKAHHDARYGGFSRLVRSTFDEALDHFRDGSIDLLHIDGLHTYEAVAHDFATWLPKISEHGVALFHDTNVRERNFGVFRLWDELIENHRGFQFLHGRGLGVLAVGKEVPESILPLFNAADDTSKTAEIRHAFAQLGKAALLHNARALSSEEKVDKKQLEQLRSMLIAEKEELARLHRATTQKDSEARQLLRDKLEAVERERAELVAEIDELRNQVVGAEAAAGAEQGRLCAELAETTVNAAHAAEEAAQKQADLSARLAEVEAARTAEAERADSLDAESRARAERIAVLKKQTVDRDARITRLKDEKALRDKRIEELNEERHKFRKSTSWKLTSPLRALKTGPRSLVRFVRSTRAAVRMGGGVVPTARKAVAIYWHEGSAGVSSRLSIVYSHDDRQTIRKAALAEREASLTWGGDLDSSTFGSLRRYDFKSVDVLDEIARDYVQKKKSHAHIFYTSISGEYDDVKFHEYLDQHAEHFLFQDDPQDTYVFQVRCNPYFDVNAARRSRYVKTHPHHLFSDVPVAIWLDGNVLIRGDLSSEIAEFTRSAMPIGAFPHPLRRSVYEEAKECIKRNKDSRIIIDEQMERYRREGFDCDDLIESNFMMFRLDHPMLPDIMSRWWTEIERGSHRDQLSFNYAMTCAGAEYFPLAVRPNSVRNHPALALFAHGTNQNRAAKPKPIVKREKARSYAVVKRERIARHRDLSADIVVCVHNALDSVKACLHSVNDLRRPNNHRIIIVDDGSGPDAQRWLERFQRDNANVALIRHDRARGYTRAASAGLRASTGDFVVLLNSDTVVSVDWLDKLIDAAHSTPGVGIVGPLSNAAGSQSIPDHRSKNGQTAINDLPPGMTIADVNQWCEANTDANFLPLVPFVHGFCFGLTRDTIEKVGYMDEENFPFGYGEENDYCLRATDKGVQLAIATHTYVFHEKSKSYTDPEKRKKLTRNGNTAIRELHGNNRVRRLVKSLQSNTHLAALRSQSLALFQKWDY